MNQVLREPFDEWQQYQPVPRHWEQSVSDERLAKQRLATKSKVALSRRQRYDKFNEVKIKHDIAMISERIRSTPVGQTEILITEYRRMKRKLRFLELVKAMHRWLN